MGAKSIQINLRVPGKVATDLHRLAQQEHASRVDLARQILLEGLAQRKRALALRLYREGKASKSRAAEIAGVSLWEMMDLIDQAAVPSSYTLQEAVEEVRRIVQQR
jgi:predicted HTH domain antitoxin